MAEKKFVSYAKLGLYHEKEVARVASVVSTAKSEANAYTDSQAKNYDAAGAAAAVDIKLTSEVSRATTREDEIAALVTTAQGDVDALETLVGTLPSGTEATSVVDYVNRKTSGIATDAALTEVNKQLSQAQVDIDAIEADYLKAADKTELSNTIATEKSRAEGVESGLDTRVKAIEDDYLKAADKTELQGNIDNVSATLAGVKEDVDYFFKDALGDTDVQQVKDTLKEIQDYIDSDATAASAMSASIKQNADDIDVLEGRMDTAEGNITTIQGNITTINGNITTLQGEDTAIKNRLDAVEAQLGDGDSSVSDLIAAAKQEAITAAGTAADEKDATNLATAKKYTDDEINKVEATMQTAVDSKASQADLTALTTRVTTAEGEIDTLQTDVDAVEELAAANKAAHEANAAAIALKASQADLNALTERVAANETAIASFVEVSEEEINALFA